MNDIFCIGRNLNIIFKLICVFHFSALLLSLLSWLLPQLLLSMPLPQSMLQPLLMDLPQCTLMSHQHTTTPMVWLTPTTVLTLEPTRTAMGKKLGPIIL